MKGKYDIDTLVCFYVVDSKCLYCTVALRCFVSTCHFMPFIPAPYSILYMFSEVWTCKFIMPLLQSRRYKISLSPTQWVKTFLIQTRPGGKFVNSGNGTRPLHAAVLYLSLPSTQLTDVLLLTLGWSELGPVTEHLLESSS